MWSKLGPIALVALSFGAALGVEAQATPAAAESKLSAVPPPPTETYIYTTVKALGVFIIDQQGGAAAYVRDAEPGRAKVYGLEYVSETTVGSNRSGWIYKQTDGFDREWFFSKNPDDYGWHLILWRNNSSSNWNLGHDQADRAILEGRRGMRLFGERGFDERSSKSGAGKTGY